MTRAITWRRAAATITAAIAVTAGSALGAGPAAADEITPGTTAQSVFESTGPHEVSTAARVGPCQQSLAGMIAHLTVLVSGNMDTLQCTAAFPYGLDMPVGVNTYYPADIASMGAAPLIVLTGGILSNPGNYDSMARFFTSHGFVVIVPFDFVNSLPEMPTLGLAAAIAQNRDANSPLFGKVDLSRTFFAGHSAGGAASMQAAALFPPIAGAIDPNLRIAGVLAMAPGPVAVGALVDVPTFYLTGYNDIVVPDFAWVRWWQYNLHLNAPAWIADARGVTHFGPVDGPEGFRSSGAALAWLEYMAFGDDTAEQFFVGPDWKLKDDKSFFSVERNALASGLG
ncbi:adenylate cyclase [Nocardia sp. ET3-3]|uniref:Adenylate cyclase n=1 Tax=Nocardia terrae TaxID=2675851 RepID=A0A7K1UY22_9NOCA|nr:adenylate cyclase [Nocardia terrae]MVU79089.1 adenylate cyclase [Nocardia terrae]